MNRDGSGVRRLTNNPAIDSTPTWSPTGTQIAFTSDRSGSPQIYVMDAGRLEPAAHHVGESWADRADVVAGAVQRDRLRRAHRAPASTSRSTTSPPGQTGTITDRRGHQREPGVLAQRPAHRVHLDARRQDADLHDRPRRQGPAADHADGNNITRTGRTETARHSAPSDGHGGNHTYETEIIALHLPGVADRAPAACTRVNRRLRGRRRPLPRRRRRATAAARAACAHARADAAAAAAERRRVGPVAGRSEPRLTAAAGLLRLDSSDVNDASRTTLQANAASAEEIPDVGGDD